MAARYTVDVSGSGFTKTGFGKSRAFPEAFTDFIDRNVYLYAPIAGTLKAGTTQAFRIRVPGANRVRVKVGSEYTELEKSGDEFSGNVPIKKGDIRVYMNQGGA